MLLSGCATSGGADWPGEAWPVSTAEAEGVDPAAIDSLIADIDAGRYGLIDHFLLIRNGLVIADRRWNHAGRYAELLAAQEDTTGHQYNYDHPSWHPYYRNTDLHSLQSVTKSVTSVAFGIALDEGHIPGVDVPAWPYFEAYGVDLGAPRRAAATVEDFLTMRSGIDWAVPGQTYEDEAHPTSVLEASDRWIDAWAEERLFRPIGIDEYYWKIAPDGEVDSEGGLYLSAHDLARIGYLMLRGGEWDGRRIVSREWVEASTAPVVPDVAPDNDRPDAGYGYQWWIPMHEDGETRVFAGNGYGGQFLHVVPEYDLISVFNGWTLHEQPELFSWMALQNRILPAVRPATDNHR